MKRTSLSSWYGILPIVALLGLWEAAARLNLFLGHLFLPGKNDIHSTGVKRHLPVEGWKGGKGLRCSGMVGRHVVPCPEQGGADAQVLWVLQQCHQGVAERRKPG